MLDDIERSGDEEEYNTGDSDFADSPPRRGTIRNVCVDVDENDAIFEEPQPRKSSREKSAAGVAARMKEIALNSGKKLAQHAFKTPAVNLSTPSCGKKSGSEPKIAGEKQPAKVAEISNKIVRPNTRGSKVKGLDPDGEIVEALSPAVANPKLVRDESKSPGKGGPSSEPRKRGRPSKKTKV